MSGIVGVLGLGFLALPEVPGPENLARSGPGVFGGQGQGGGGGGAQQMAPPAPHDPILALKAAQTVLRAFYAQRTIGPKIGPVRISVRLGLAGP